MSRGPRLTTQCSNSLLPSETVFLCLCKYHVLKIRLMEKELVFDFRVSFESEMTRLRRTMAVGQLPMDPRHVRSQPDPSRLSRCSRRRLPFRALQPLGAHADTRLQTGGLQPPVRLRQTTTSDSRQPKRRFRSISRHQGSVARLASSLTCV